MAVILRLLPAGALGDRLLAAGSRGGTKFVLLIMFFLAAWRTLVEASLFSRVPGCMVLAGTFLRQRPLVRACARLPSPC